MISLIVFHSFLLGVRMITCILADIPHRRSGLTYCNALVTSRRFYYGLNLTDDPGNANFRSPILKHYIRMIKYYYV